MNQACPAFVFWRGENCSDVVLFHHQFSDYHMIDLACDHQFFGFSLLKLALATELSAAVFWVQTMEFDL